MTALLTIPEAAARLRLSRRQFDAWLKRRPCDRDGRPFYRKAGRTKLFTEGDVSRIVDQMAAEQRRAAQRIKDEHEMLPNSPASAAQFGWVYFLRAGDLIKIGHSRGPRGRLATLRTGSPLKLDLLHIEAGAVSKERALHRRFDRLRSHGEWFRAEHELLAYIDLLKGGTE